MEGVGAFLILKPEVDVFIIVGLLTNILIPVGKLRPHVVDIAVDEVDFFWQLESHLNVQKPYIIITLIILFEFFA